MISWKDFDPTKLVFSEIEEKIYTKYNVKYYSIDINYDYGDRIGKLLIEAPESVAKMKFEEHKDFDGPIKQFTKSS
jgi:hypothetical protein